MLLQLVTGNGERGTGNVIEIDKLLTVMHIVGAKFLRDKLCVSSKSIFHPSSDLEAHVV